MKKLRPILILVGVLALLAAPFVLYYPVHDLLGRCNTRYSQRFSDAAFSQVHVGMSRERVLELLGAPLSAVSHRDHPVWALTEEQVRDRYGKDNKIAMEVLSFSEAKQGGDYEFVQVALGKDSTVIGTSKWVTD